MSVEMNKKFKDDPHNFMRDYAVDAGNAIGNQGVKVADLDGGENNFEDYALNNMALTHLVGYLDFNKQNRAQNTGLTFGQNNVAPAGLVCVRGSYVADPNMVKAYYLPWRDNHIIRLAIPAMGTALVDDDTKIFFTAAISGCSVFVKGTPQAPIIFHAGGNTRQKNVHMASKFWRDMLNQNVLGQGVGQEVNKTHYVTDTGALDGDKSTTHSRQFETWLKDSASSNLNIEQTAATGCVMGIRDLVGNWAFYLQENITITHSTFRKNIFGKLTNKSVTGSQRMSSRPMLFRRFFPGGFAHADFTPSLPRKL